jgi:subtilisin family serine protease
MKNPNIGSLLLLVSLALPFAAASQPLASQSPAAAAAIAKPPEADPVDGRKWRLQKDAGKERIYRARGRLIVVLRDGARSRMAKKGFSSPRMKNSSALAPNAEIANFDEDKVGFDAMKSELLANPDVASVEPDLRVRASGRAPDQAKASNVNLTAAQHGRSRIRRSGKKAAKAVRVGILDTGIDFLHPDLDGAVESGVNLIYVKPEVALPNDEGSDSSEMDYNGHGTQVAGIIGAERNDIGIDGLSEAKLVGIKAFNKEGEGRLSDVIAGIQWAMDHRVDVLNMSCGTYEYSAAFEKVVAAAVEKGMVIVAAAGNDHAGEAAYPARFPGVLSIGSEGETGETSDFSNFGAQVELFAPGERIISTSLHTETSAYKVFNGTSAACAHVSGLIAAGVSEGADAAAAVAALRKTGEKRLAFFAPGNPDFTSVHREAYLSTLRKEAVSRLTLTGVGANRRLWKTGETVKLEYRVQNTGTKATPAMPLSLKLTEGEGSLSVPLASIPALKPGEIRTASVTLPKEAVKGAHVYDAVLAPSAGALSVEGFDRKVHVNVLAEDGIRLYASSLWLNNLEPGKTAGRKLMLKVMNIGNAAAPAVTVLPTMQAGGHCEFGRVGADIVGAAVAMGSLKPGESREMEIAVPDMSVPAQGSFTVMASFVNGTDTLYRPKKQMESFQKGFLRLFYSQEVHRWIAREAVNLLKLDGVYIPDLMKPGATFLGGVTPYFDIDHNTSSFNMSATPYWDNSAFASWTSPTLVNGAHDCDETDIIFHYTGMDLFDTHFWKVDQDDATGHSYGTLGNHHHSALDRIRALMYGKSMVPDSHLDKGAIEHYKKGYKAAAWYFLGHVMHLIGDMSVPSHIDDSNWHGIWGDGYHDWMDHGYYDDFGSAQIAKDKFGGMINPYQSAAAGDPVRFLTYTTAQVGGAYSYGNADNNPTHNNYTGTGNRVAGGNAPHYDAYMDQVFAKMKELNREIGLPEVHPTTGNEITQVETRDFHWGGSTCEWTTSICTGFPCYEEYSDCKDSNGHIDKNNTYFMDDNADRDLEAIARMNVNYAIRAAAGMIYYFAKETGQLNYRTLPAINSLLLQ